MSKFTDNSAYSIDKALMRRAFAKAATTYDQVAVMQHEVGQRMLERMQLLKVQPEIILDLGAGTGKHSVALDRLYRKARVVALDIALPMCQQARRIKPWLSKLRCVCGDIECLPFADASADMIFSNLCLQWARDLDKTFAEFRRVLKPDGVLMFTTFGPDTLKELRHSWAQVDDRIHVNSFLDMHDIGDALLRAGLSEPVMDVEQFTLTYPDVRGLMRDLKQVGAHNVTQGRRRSLTGKSRLRAMQQAYEGFRQGDVLPASSSVYGHAWIGATARSSQTEVPIDTLLPRGRKDI